VSYAHRLRLGSSESGQQYRQARWRHVRGGDDRVPLARSLIDPDDGAGAGEERWVTLGQAATGNLLVVVHTWVEIDPNLVAVRIISARRPTRREARQYREDPLP
jgi:uncharacterized DUF497 family protein